MSDSKTAIELLCKLLDERGVSCQTNYLHASWRVGPKLYDAVDNFDGTLTVDNLTPEQAIAATLGGGECEELLEELRSESLKFPPAIRRKVNIGLDRIEQVIAATLGSGECEYKPMWDEDDPLAEEYLGMWYTSCGDALIWNADKDGCWEPPKFCPYCGGAVKR